MPRILSHAGIAMAMVFSIISNLAWAQSSTPIKVMTSIKPLQLITQELTKGVTDSEVLLANNTSPHDYALKPSDVRKLKEADIFIWVGPGLESFLEGALKESQNALQLDQYDSIDKFVYDEHEGHEHHDDGHHHHGNYDPHLWLGPAQAQQMAKVIVDKLSQIDSKHAAQYTANYESFVEQLNATTEKIKQQLAPVKDHGYYVFHDAYEYYEQYFGLKHLGAFTVSPDRRPGAKSLIAIRTALQGDQVYCVFSEPQFTPAVIDSTTRGTKVSHGVLDPLATDVAVQPGAYFQFLQQLADNFTQCLTR
ncbi:zinc ABC transporter substrate-binding protein ZnuA [Vibrio gangliei]|uniref:zinc ABC transporter substrate-binding protein ZnuA n=1 Tax=Vibrio gangliei TaxID=2077090 RepID=UPI000D0140C4|nr:zinc ABC transporter substrate-binding protein ZnuA [Vibrio gangliei]